MGIKTKEVTDLLGNGSKRAGQTILSDALGLVDARSIRHRIKHEMDISPKWNEDLKLLLARKVKQYQAMLKRIG